MSDEKILKDIEGVSRKLNQGKEAGQHGEWSKAERPLRDAHSDLGKVVREVEDRNDLDRLINPEAQPTEGKE